ncbi:MAG: hypothetical protein JWP35_1027 [Caulobacter sp.]|nr:hypothetical protein [Caulobacter sp.]
MALKLDLPIKHALPWIEPCETDLAQDQDNADGSSDHEFGGHWTEVKLDAISEYLNFFTSALKNRAFRLWYVDAFAGTGARTAKRVTGGIFEGQPIGEEKVQLDGSAKRALAVSPPFHDFVFMEQHGGRFAALSKLKTANPTRNIVVTSGDGNEALRGLFSSPPWSHQKRGKGPQRAVVFLDPYAMSVRWNTLQLLAETGAVDVWYLFPLNAVVRQLAHDFSAVDQAKQASLDEIFGTADWRSELYATDVQPGLFEVEVSSTRRVASQKQIQTYAMKRLKTLFPYVSDPLPLLTPGGAQLFSLFCASANESPAARALVAKGVSHVLKKYG